jgi:hypothetical protein
LKFSLGDRTCLGRLPNKSEKTCSGIEAGHIR